MVCYTCYHRRRRYVRAIDAPESHTYTRWATVCCLPCSETQQWRELRNSGVWPGLMVCEPSAQDRAAMSPTAVAARFGHLGLRSTREDVQAAAAPLVAWSGAAMR